MDQKNQQSKSRYGTLTATRDANGDYPESSMTALTTGAASTSAGASAGSGSYVTGATTPILTSQHDANGDYNQQNRQKSGNQNNQKNKNPGQSSGQ